MPIIQDRLDEVLASKTLGKGAHEQNGVGCFMELVSYIAGEKWSDAPQCTCPVIGAFMRSWNDWLPDDASRERLLKPLFEVVIDTRSTPAVELQRAWMATDWLVREHLPAWLDLTPSLKPHAAALRATSPMINAKSAKAIQPLLDDARKDAAAARDAAWDAAGAAAWDAAGAAAWAAARAAARDAARDAAWDAAGAAAWDAAGAAAGAAAWDAAGAAAGDAAWAAARDALQPTVEKLQASAQDLVRRMCAVKP